jgi:hypothetical protein
MDELMDMMVDDQSPSQISDKIKELLYNKSAQKVDDFKDNVANSLFGDQTPEEDEVEVDDDDEIVDEVDTDEVETEDEEV